MWVDLKGEESVPDTVHHCVVRVGGGNKKIEKDEFVITDAVHKQDGKLENSVEEEMSVLDTQSEQLKQLKPKILMEVSERNIYEPQAKLNYKYTTQLVWHLLRSAQLIDKFEMDQVLVFCRTNLDCDLLERFFIGFGGGTKFTGKRESGPQNKYSCCVLAGMRSMQERRQNLEAFKELDVRILIATDVAARGIDIQGLPFVINLTLPDLTENYIHRVGRVGRAERMGLAISLVAAEGVKEKVWYCQNKKKPPQFDRGLFAEGGNCIYYDEGALLKGVEKRLGELPITEISYPELVLPENIVTMLKSGGYGEMADDSHGMQNEELALHLESLKGEVKDLGVMEFQLQANYLRMRTREWGLSHTHHHNE